MPRKQNLRTRKEGVKWIKDDTLDAEESEESEWEDESEAESEDFTEEEDEPMEAKIQLPKGSTMTVQLIMNMKPESMEEEEAEDPFIQRLMDKQVNKPGSRRQSPALRGSAKDALVPHLELNEDEEDYQEGLSKAKRRALNEKMKSLAQLVKTGDIPLKFRVLEMPISDAVKASVIKKLDALEEMEGGENFKLKNWVDQFFQIPFGKQIPLPVKMADGQEPCSKFLSTARVKMDEAVYGMLPAKAQVMQILAQWIANPNSVGNVIALKGPMGVGKTSFARHGIANVLERPFAFFSLGGASDSATFVGHSFTQEGSMCGRIVEALTQTRCMNPVLQFDELDKISSTDRGEEIVNLLIHLTDRSQNSQFHDRQFAGIDFDLSQCLFVFSFNDESKVHPILRDRLQVISCSGQEPADKKVILENYIWKQLQERLAFKDGDLILPDESVKFLIEEYSKDEEGVRNLIRAAESLVTRINLLRIADSETRKSYKFGRDVEFPLKLTPEIVAQILQEQKPKKDEAWRSMQT